MKRYLFLIAALIAVLSFGLPALGQQTEQAKERQVTIRKRWQNMSEQERQQLRARFRERISSGPGPWRAEQMKAIEAIEEQIAKLKQGLETIGRESRVNFRELSPQERAKLRQKWTKLRQERQKAIAAIEQQLAKLKGERQIRAQREGTIAELREIHELALKEKAEATAKRIQQLIKRQQREFQGRLRRSGGERPARMQRPERVQVLQPRRKAPEFTLKSFDGKTMTLSDYRGKIVVLEWFNFECPYVQYHYNKVPTMVKLANKYKDQDVVWLAINSTSHTTVEANKEFVRKHNLPYPILDDRSGRVGRAYGAKTTPHMFVIDRRGNIAYEGAIDNSPMGRKKEEVINYVDKALSELLSGKPVSIPETKPYGCSVKYPK